MRHALTVEQVRQAEACAEAAGVSLHALMEAAGAALATSVRSAAPAGRVAVLCGPGNNGGDGWVAARHLHEAGRDVTVVTCKNPDELNGDAADAARRAIAGDVPWTLPADASAIGDALASSAVVVDALLGIGSSGPPRGLVADAIRSLSGIDAFVVSADIPSGVDADTGATPGAVVRAHLTVTFGALKPGLLLHPGTRSAGEVRVADVGVPDACLPSAGTVEVWDASDHAAVLPRPPLDAHKNECGRLMIIAGSRAYTGAAVLAVRGALRMGAGYVTLAVPESIARTMQAKLTSAVVVGLPENPGGTLASKTLDTVEDMCREHDAVVVGPGLTVAQGTVLLVRRLVRDTSIPLVLDADGLNALVDATDILLARAHPTVLTPHPGELGRLVGATPAEVQADRIGSARRLAGPHRACVLKGARTVVAGGGRTAITMSGNPGMATAGAGDVLAGMCGTLLARGVAPFEVGVLAAHLHAEAGDRAAEALTETCMTAEDIPEYLPHAVRSIGG